MERYKFAISAFFGISAFLFGGWDGLMTVLLACIVIDYISGVICAAYEKKLSSRIGARGIAKKIMIFLIVITASLADTYIIGTGDSLRTLTVLFYIANESISILENCGRLGVPVPKRLTDMLIRLKEKEENNERN